MFQEFHDAGKNVFKFCFYLYSHTEKIVQVIILNLVQENMADHGRFS